MESSLTELGNVRHVREDSNGMMCQGHALLEEILLRKLRTVKMQMKKCALLASLATSLMDKFVLRFRFLIVTKDLIRVAQNAQQGSN